MAGLKEKQTADIGDSSEAQASFSLVTQKTPVGEDEAVVQVVKKDEQLIEEGLNVLPTSQARASNPPKGNARYTFWETLRTIDPSFGN